VPEQLALAEQVQDLILVDDLDRPALNDAQVLDRPLALGEDHAALGVVLGLRRHGQALDVVLRERVEGWVRPQKAGYVSGVARLRGRVAQPEPGAAVCGAPADASCPIISAHFSPIIIVVMHGLIAGRNGRIEPSQTRSPATPRTRKRGSQTAC